MMEMEMTSRRSSSSGSWFEKSSTTTAQENVADWCNTEVVPLNRGSDSVSSNRSRSTGSTRIKRFQLVLLLIAVFVTMQLLNNGPSAIDPVGMEQVTKKNDTEHLHADENSATAAPQISKGTPLPTLRPTAPSSPFPTDKEETSEPTKDDDDQNNIQHEGSIDGDVTPTTSPSFFPTIKLQKPDATTTIETSNQLRTPPSHPELSDIARSYVETHCDLRQVKDGAWYPSGPEDDWKQRAPYLIIAGVWNGGVNPLRDALLKNPQVHPSKTEDFFLPRNFYRFITPTSNKSMNSNNQTASTGNVKVKVFAARERMYASAYSKALYQKKYDEQSSLIETVNNETNGINKHVGIDFSPGLLFYAQKTAHSVLCTAPWVKVIVVLRNPIDRLYQQWAFGTKNLQLKKPLEDWMAKEMKLLQSVGLMAGGEENGDKDPAVLSEKDAWEKYQSVRGLGGAIGRSMYAFQMEEWIQAYVSAGKNPSEEILILTAEDIVEDPERKYAEIMSFVGLNSDEGVASALANSLSQKPNAEPMSKETRKMLKKFFKPYNKRLTKLLTSNGFEGNWDELWK